MSEYMLMFSLGPVQPFIAQARKTRDLWLGSYLLAKLMEAAVKDLKGELVYPTRSTVDDRRGIPDIPNKFVAIFPSEEAAYEEIGRCVTRIENRWEKICKEVWQEIVEPYATRETERIWNRQTNAQNLFETYWVIVPDSSREYKQWLSYSQEVLDARKRLRNFASQSKRGQEGELREEGEPGEKSTVSGEREALHGMRTDRQGVQDFWVKLTSKLSAHDISKDGSERLDAIDTVKRFATESEEIPGKPFPSTSYIAAAPFMETLLLAPIDQGVLDRWQEATNKQLKLREGAKRAVPYLHEMVMINRQLAERDWMLQRDGDLYFPEMFVPRQLMQNYGIADVPEATSIARNGKDALGALLRATDELKITRPTPYYALIQMDGDKMGSLLGSVNDKEEHIAISEALSKFSRTLAPELIEDIYPGKLIYAGGDDIVALAPLARDIHMGNEPVTFLEMVDELGQVYHDTVQEPVSGDERKAKVTASIGVAIAHHYTSLSYVRRTAKASEDIAKKDYGRNALVVTILRRSGEQTRVGCHWFYKIVKDGSEQTIRPLPLFSQFYDFFKKDVLSPKCVYILLEEAPVLIGLARDAQISEIKRVLQRQHNKEVEGEFADRELAQRLVELAEAMDNDERRSRKVGQSLAVELHSEERRYGLVEVLGWLLVMAFLARKEPE